MFVFAMNWTAFRSGAAIMSGSSSLPKMSPSICICRGSAIRTCWLRRSARAWRGSTWQTETFAYADGWDEQKKRYKGLRAGQSIRVLVDAGSLLVKPDVAAAQMEADRPQAGGGTAGGNGGGVGTGGGTPPAVGPGKPGTGPGTTGGGGRRRLVAPLPKRFYGSVKLDSMRLSRDADKVAQEIVQHLNALVGAETEVILEVHSKIPDGASPELVRTITENCRTLRFENYGFEET